VAPALPYGRLVPPVRPEPMEPHPSRLATDHPFRGAVLAAHDHAVRAGRSRYPDPLTGYWVFTAAHLLERGTCCASGCRHCPYVGA
jgi:Family of unknown function (DUF5522)